MRLAGLALGVAALAGAAAALPAVACSAPADPRGNLEQVADAETILLGRVISGSGAAGDPQDWSIVVRPLEAIKGALPQGDITYSGLALSTIDGGSALSNPFEFERAHPNAYAGACNRYLFPLGTTVLFLLERDETEPGVRPLTVPSAAGPKTCPTRPHPGCSSSGSMPWRRVCLRKTACRSCRTSARR